MILLKHAYSITVYDTEVSKLTTKSC